MWETMGTFVLTDFDNHNNNADQSERAHNSKQNPPARDGKGEDNARQEEEHEDDVDDGEPAVGGRPLAQKLGHGDGEAQAGHRVEEHYCGEVEDEVAQRHLEGVQQLLAGQRREDGGGGGADVGAQSQRVHPVYLDDADAHQWGEGGREDGRRLDHDGQTRAHQDGEITGEVAAHSGEVGVDELLDEDRHGTLGIHVQGDR